MSNIEDYTSSGYYNYLLPAIGGRDATQLRKAEWEDIERKIFQQITPKMRRLYANQIMFVNATTLEICYFKKSFDAPSDPKYTGVFMLCYRMPRVMSNEDPRPAN